jgi:hypothetical protein
MRVQESSNTPGMWYIMENDSIIRVHYSREEAVKVMKAIRGLMKAPRRKKPTNSERNMELDALVSKTMRAIKRERR